MLDPGPDSQSFQFHLPHQTESLLRAPPGADGGLHPDPATGLLVRTHRLEMVGLPVPVWPGLVSKRSLGSCEVEL